MTTKIEHQIFSYETLSILEIGNTGDGTTRTFEGAYSGGSDEIAFASGQERRYRIHTVRSGPSA